MTVQVSKTTHVSTFLASAGGRVTDMTNAGKPGKRCRTFRFRGALDYFGSRPPWAADVQEYQKENYEIHMKLIRYTREIFAAVGENGFHDKDYDTVRLAVESIVATAWKDGLTMDQLSIHFETIRGVDAPKPVLRAGQEGIWSASADQDGIHIRQLNDVNEWTEITSSTQTSNQAYKLAAKVWDKVKEAKTRLEASQILANAGCRLHGFCGMD